MEVSYGKEPFDLRLMCLRLCRDLWKILAVTVVGTLLFGGGYYVKNVVLQPDPGYAASSTYKVEYKENPNAAGAYYINEATWNTMNFWMVWRSICRRLWNGETMELRKHCLWAETSGSQISRHHFPRISVFR